MVPWSTDSLLQGGRTPRAQDGPASEKTFAFLSKSFVDLQKEAESDLKLRTQKWRELASQLDDWENIKVPASPLTGGKDVTAGVLLKQIRDRSKTLTSPVGPLEEWEKIRVPASRLTGGKDVTAGHLFQQIRESSKALTKAAPLEEWELVKNFQQHVPPALRKLQETPMPIPLKPFVGRQIVNLDDFNRAVKNQKWPQVESWAPLKKVKEGLKELETAAGSEHAVSAQTFKDNLHPDVPPLAVSELLESLARQYEGLLQHLGVDSKQLVKQLPGKKDSQDVEARLMHVKAATGYRVSTPVTVFTPRGKMECVEGQELQLDGASRDQQQQLVVSSGKERAPNVAIVTTASLPWMTGTAVNPLLRAAYLANQLGQQQTVTLVIPWLTKAEQGLVFPQGLTFDTPEQQEAYVRNWVTERVGFSPANLNISFYPGMYSQHKRSIFPVGDVCGSVPGSREDVVILEEPEHLTWYHPGRRWAEKFKRVVGVIHTNYLEYIRREKNGGLQAFVVEHVNHWTTKCNCTQIIRLSGATQELPRSHICNVHGVGERFLAIGEKMAAAAAAIAEGKMVPGKQRKAKAASKKQQQQQAEQSPAVVRAEASEGAASTSSTTGSKSSSRVKTSAFSKGAYYLGKMVWGKGYRELLDLLEENRESLGDIDVDVFGSGADSGEVRAEAQSKKLRVKFHPGRDHADTSLHGFKLFINPSLSDVLCTTTLEALAMGKWVVCADHPSNHFFRSFHNCRMYKTPQEFVECVRQAMEAEPRPLTPEERHSLTWQAATQRFMQSAGLSETAAAPAADSILAPAAAPMRISQTCPDLCSSHLIDVDQSTVTAAPVAASPSGHLALSASKKRAPLALPLGLASASLSFAPVGSDAKDFGLAADDIVYHVLKQVMLRSEFLRAQVLGAPAKSLNVNAEMSADLGLPSPWVQRPTYGW